jgi:hypothetical protein
MRKPEHNLHQVVIDVGNFARDVDQLVNGNRLSAYETVFLLPAERGAVEEAIIRPHVPHAVSTGIPIHREMALDALAVIVDSLNLAATVDVAPGYRLQDLKFGACVELHENCANGDNKLWRDFMDARDFLTQLLSGISHAHALPKLERDSASTSGSGQDRLPNRSAIETKKKPRTEAGLKLLGK